MNKPEFIAAVSDRCAITKKDAENIVNNIREIIFDTLVSGEKIQLIGFGSFEVHERQERECINPKTKEKILCPAAYVPVFKMSKSLKDRVNDERYRRTKKSKKSKK